MRGAGRVFFGAIVLMSAACGRVVEPVVLVPCSSGECWDLSAGIDVFVNDEPASADVGLHEAHAWRFHTIPGHQYLVLTRVYTGRADT
jgi:hypothetical protein